MKTNIPANNLEPESQVYSIRIKGHLDPRWSEWFDGMTVTPVSDLTAETIITGVIVDQAALHGMLARIRDLGLSVIAFNPVDDSTARQVSGS